MVTYICEGCNTPCMVILSGLVKSAAFERDYVETKKCIVCPTHNDAVWHAD